MRRREFITLLGGTAVAWPLGADAQRAGKFFRVGWIYPNAPVSDMAGPDPVQGIARTFVHALRDLGYVEGRNLVLERRSAEGRYERYGEITAELVQRKVDVIVTASTAMTLAAKQVTNTVPIVMASSQDPVGAGLVASLARPGGNITGFTNNTGVEFEARRLQMLKEAHPKSDARRLPRHEERMGGPSGEAPPSHRVDPRRGAGPCGSRPNSLCRCLRSDDRSPAARDICFT